jgi:short-subunit dehydrogenase
MVAGAGQGIGAAWAEALAARGLHLVLVDREAEPLGTLAARLRASASVTIETAIADLAEPAAIEQVAALATARELGLFVYNAAFCPIGEFVAVAAGDLRRAIAVNCLGPTLLAHRVGSAMKARRRGGIVLMASLSGFQGGPYVALYAATKAYALVLAEGLWDECREYGVDVLACCPGATRTPGYLASRPRAAQAWSPPEMEPQVVVAEALAALGTTASVFPGRANRWGAFAMQRLLTRARAVKIMGRVGRRLERPNG